MEESNKIDNADLVKLFINIIKDMEEKHKQEIALLTGKLEMESCLVKDNKKMHKNRN